MTKFLKPGFFVNRLFNEEDKDWTIAELNRFEYFEIIDTLKNLKKNLNQLTIKNEELKTNKDNYQKKYNEINKIYQNKIEELKNSQNQIKNLSEKILMLKKHNENLMRINKEKTNAKRGLTPKKTHHGYLKKVSEQYKYKFYFFENRIRKIGTINSWKNVIQTPYPLIFSSEKTKELILNDLKKLKIELVNFKDLDTWEEVCDLLDSKNGIPIIYDLKLKENIKQNLWEFEVLSYNLLKL